MTHTPDNVLRRLEILRGKLEADGSYVSANTVVLAQELIRELTGAAIPVTSRGDMEA